MPRPRRPTTSLADAGESAHISGPPSGAVVAGSASPPVPALQLRRPAGLAGPSADLWLLCCALVGAIFWLLSASIDAESPFGASNQVDLAIGRGLPMLSLELGLDAQGVSFIDDVEDVSRAIEGGLARVGVDAEPAGVRIIHRPEAGNGVPVLVKRLHQTLPEASTQVLGRRWSLQRFASLLLVLLVVNVGALVLLRQLERLQRGEWLRWLALQGAGVPGLVVGAMVRQALLSAGLGLFAFGGLLGVGEALSLLPLIVLLALLSVWFGALLAVATGWRVWLWLSVQGLLVTAWSFDPGPAGHALATTNALLPAVLLVGLLFWSVLLRARLLAGFRGGEA